VDERESRYLEELVLEAMEIGPMSHKYLLERCRRIQHDRGATIPTDFTASMDNISCAIAKLIESGKLIAAKVRSGAKDYELLILPEPPAAAG
jgi:hypothetical protein